MARILKTRKPNAKEIRRLEYLLETTTDPQVQRRAEALLDYALGLNALEIAQALQVHGNTVYADLRAFARQGLACVVPLPKGGAPARITLQQQAEIWRLAECAPGEFGFPEGRWSLARFQDFLIKKRRVLKQISVEHLRRVLKKKTFGSGASNANSSAMTRSAGPF
jgi:transposase